MALITPKQIQVIYALGSKTGTLESGNKDDELHSIVFRVSGKASIKELTQKDFKAVTDELHKYLNDENKITEKQKGLAWRYIYRLVELDTSESKAKAGTRMVGAIKKILELEVTDIKKPFDNVTAEQGEKLIENLKRYVKTAEKKQGKSKEVV